jgi:hypothetical protein
VPLAYTAHRVCELLEGAGTTVIPAHMVIGGCDSRMHMLRIRALLHRFLLAVSWYRRQVTWLGMRLGGVMMEHTHNDNVHHLID